MTIGIHQPHFLPWLGFLDKMAKSDVFILLDDVQLELCSPMLRNKFLAINASEKYVTLPCVKSGFQDKPYTEILHNNDIDWQKRHTDFFFGNYKKAPYFKEIWQELEPIYKKEYEKLSDVAFDSLMLAKRLFDINTNIVLQSTLDYDKEKKNNDLVLDLCLKVGADKYLSGNGARKYMTISDFTSQGVNVSYQHFSYPEYSQINSTEFVPNMSSFDMLFNCGIEQSREIFKKNVEANPESYTEE